MYSSTRARTVSAGQSFGEGERPNEFLINLLYRFILHQTRKSIVGKPKIDFLTKCEIICSYLFLRAVSFRTSTLQKLPWPRILQVQGHRILLLFLYCDLLRVAKILCNRLLGKRPYPFGSDV